MSDTPIVSEKDKDFARCIHKNTQSIMERQGNGTTQKFIVYAGPKATEKDMLDFSDAEKDLLYNYFRSRQAYMDEYGNDDGEEPIKFELSVTMKRIF